MATDSVLYIVSVRPQYLFNLCSKSLVYAFQARKTAQHCVMFWDAANGEQNCKPVDALLVLTGHGNHVLIVTKAPGWQQFTVTIYNSIGTPVDNRTVQFEPTMAAMTGTHAIVCSSDMVFVWNFCTSQVCHSVVCQVLVIVDGFVATSSSSELAVTCNMFSLLSASLGKGQQAGMHLPSMVHDHSDHSVCSVKPKGCVDADEERKALAAMQGRLTALETPAALAAETFELIFHISEGGPVHTGSIESYMVPDVITSQPITAVCAGPSTVLLAQQDGPRETSIRKMSLPEVQQLDFIRLPCVVQRMWLNCDSSKVAVIDAQVQIFITFSERH